MAEEVTPSHPISGRCIYGFAILVLSICGFLIYATWALVPSSILIKYGLVYFSSKYYALAIPAFLCTVIYLFGHFIYPSITFLLTYSPNSMNVLIDQHSRSFKPQMRRSRIEPVYDLDIEEVSRQLYLYEQEVENESS